MVWHSWFCKNWISSFLSGRTQCVVLDGVSSPSCSVLSGVPQGTVLGPTLFSVYINDLPESILHSSVKLFADECILYKAIHSPADTVKLQEDLCALQDWQHRWLMKLNASKCFVMSISHPRRNKIISLSISCRTLQIFGCHNSERPEMA